MDPTNNHQLPSINGAEMNAAPVSAPPVDLPTDAAAHVPAAVQVASSSTPAVADDADLIEKEWVVKARQIVDQTKNDPYIQNQQMNQMKADYIKKRYNKDLKVEES